MKKNKLITAGIWVGTCLSILLVILIVHIAMVSKHQSNDLRNRQLSRIDFTSPITPKEGNKIKSFVAKLEGIEGTYFNVTNGILVYTYQPDIQNSKNVFEQVMKLGNYVAKPYVINKEQAKSGCPVNPNTTTYKVTAYISHLIN